MSANFAAVSGSTAAAAAATATAGAPGTIYPNVQLLTGTSAPQQGISTISDLMLR